MKKRILILLSIFFATNLLSFGIGIFFFEYSATVDSIVQISTEILFFIFSAFLSLYIVKNFKNIFIPISILYVILLLLRTGAVIFEESIFSTILLMFSWLSFTSPQLIINDILREGDDYLYTWSILVFPFIQPLFCILFSYIIKGFYKIKARKLNK